MSTGHEVQQGKAEKPQEGVLGDSAMIKSAGVKMSLEGNHGGRDGALASMVPNASDLPVAYGKSQFSLAGSVQQSDTKFQPNAVLGAAGGEIAGKGGASEHSKNEAMDRLSTAASGGPGMHAPSDTTPAQKKQAAA